MFPYKLYLLLVFFTGSNSSPLGHLEDSLTSNSSAETIYVGFVGDPNGRGTTSLVISCLLTLILCVWSALHLNVPNQSQTAFERFFLCSRWIVAGVYAPELVVFTAWRQWSSAKILGGIVRNLNDEKSRMSPTGKKRDSGRRHEWTMTHEFFASIGGFAFEIDSSHDGDGAEQFLPADCPRRLAITARGMALLARCGHLPDISKAEIADKSKANDIAKALVLLQALWMLFQVIGRVIAGLPVTLLEINTIAHVICAFLMYAMWWHKPLAPNEPLVLKGDWVKPLFAYMYMSSEISGEVDPRSIESQTMVKTLFACLRLYSKVPEIESMSFTEIDSDQRISTTDSPDFEDSSWRTISATSNDSNQTNPSRSPDPPEDQDHWPHPRVSALRPASKACLTQLQPKNLSKVAGTAFFERRPRVKGLDPTTSHIAQKRWDLATTAIQTYPAIRSHHHLLHSHHSATCQHFRSEELLASRIQNWPWDDLLRNVGGLVVGMILWLACFVYGAIHLTAWNTHFPSESEKWLWRASSLYITFCGGLWVVLNYVTQAYDPLNTFWEGWMDGAGRWWQNVAIGVPVVLCGLSLVFARAFIVVEAFVSIRKLPEQAYQTPTWTQVFPHF